MHHSLILTYNEILDAVYVPNISTFTLKVDGTIVTNAFTSDAVIIFAVESLPAASTNVATTLPLAAIEDISSAGTSTVQSVPLEVNATDV
jgi:hypothetical protein